MGVAVDRYVEGAVFDITILRIRTVGLPFIVTSSIVVLFPFPFSEINTIAIKLVGPDKHPLPARHMKTVFTLRLEGGPGVPSSENSGTYILPEEASPRIGFFNLELVE